MELSGVSKLDEECVTLHLEEQLRECHIKDICYLPEKESLLVFFADDRVTDDLLERNRSFIIEGKNYRATRLYNAELLDISNVELALLYLDTYVGKVVHSEYFDSEQRLLVVFDAAEALEELCKQECHLIDDGIAFRVKRASNEETQPKLLASLPQQQQQQQQGGVVQQPDWQQDSRRRKKFMQQQRQQQQPLQQQQQQQKTPSLLLQRLPLEQQTQPLQRQQQQQQQQQQQKHQQPLIQQPLQQQWQLRDQGGSTDFYAKQLVIIHGIPETISRPALELELTKQWKQIGVNYRHVEYNPSSGVAVVSFSAADDVLKVMQGGTTGRWPISACDGLQRLSDLLGDVVLLVDNITPEFSTEALWCWMKIAVGDFAHTIVYSANYTMAAATFTYCSGLNLDEVANHAKMNAVGGRRLHVTVIRQTKCAQAVDLPVSSAVLKKYLEDPQNGGRPGSVACLDITSQCAAIITFSNEYALNHAMSHRHMLLDKEITLVPLFDDLGPVVSSKQLCRLREMKHALIAAGDMTTIPSELTISGIDSQKLDELALRQFLSQRRVSGGGEIRSFSCRGGKVVVTFMDSDCATRVYQKFECEGLMLCGCRLSASLRAFEISDDAHKDRVLLRNIGVASDESLKYWLWGISVNRVHRIDFIQSKEDSQLCAIAYFERDVDFRRLACSLKAVTLDGLLVEPDIVSQPKSVLVANIPDDTHPDLVGLCFGHIGSVQEVREVGLQQWVVTFSQSGDAARACREKIVYRGGIVLRTSLYINYQLVADARKAGQRGRLVLPLDFVDGAVISFVLAKRKTAFDDLLQTFGSTVSTENQHGPPTIVCSLPPSDPRYRDVVQRWQTLQEACLAFFAPFRSRSIPIETTVYEALVASDNYLCFTRDCQHDLMVISRLQHDQSILEIILVGTSRATEEAFSAIQSIVRDVSDSMERSKKRVTRVTDRLAEMQMKLLDSIGFRKNAQSCYKDFSLDFDWEKRVICFEGKPGDIVTVTENLRGILSGSSESMIKMTSALMVLLQKTEIRELVDDQLKQKKLDDKIVWCLKPSAGVCVLGIDSQSAHDAAAVIRSQFVDLPIDLDVDSEQLTKTEKWETFSRDIIKKYRENLVLSKLDAGQNRTALQVSCTVADSERVAEEVQEFLRRHTLKEDFLCLTRITVLFILKFMQQDIMLHVEKAQSHNFVKLHPVGESASGSAKAGFKIVGNRNGIINAKRTLAHVMRTQKVSTKQHKISLPGAEMHFKSHETILTRIGNETKTIICVSSGTDDDVELHLDESGLLAASQVSLPCGTELHVLRGDIVQLSCDAIVNPANGKLRHTGGLAQVIAEGGGQVIVDECAVYIREHGQLSDGQVCVTEAGALPCKKIIHAVGPQWQGGSHNEENKLFNAIQNLLSAAVRHRLTSVAIPPISSGIFGYPLEKSTMTIVESVIDFCKNDVKPKKIVLIDNKNEGVKYFKQAVEQLVSRSGGAASNARSTGLASADTPKPSSITQEPALLKLFSFMRNKIKKVQTAQPDARQPLKFGNTLLELVEGSLVDQKVDVIVNTVGPRLQLDEGALSRSVSVAAGPALQIDLRQNYPNGIAAGEIGYSKGYQLPCQFVFHCCCSYWSSGKSEQVLSNLLYKCLSEASKRGMSSIAIPAIGTGQLGFPALESARITYETVLQYYRRHARSSVRHVKLIVHGQPQVVAAYQAQHCAILRDGGISSAQPGSQQSSPQRGRGTLSKGSAPQRVSGTAVFNLDLNICGSEDCINAAKQALEQYCQKNIVEYIERDPEDGCRTISSSQVDDLVQQGMEDGVAIEVDRQSSTVIIRSLHRSAAKALQLQVRNTLTGQRVERLQQETVASRCQWQYKDLRGQWHDYEPALNAKLEQAHRTGQKSVPYRSEDENKYLVSFTDMKDYADGNPSNAADVQRIDKAHGIFSSTNEKYSEELVTKGSQDYTKVEAAFFKTALPSFRIVEIKRVRNPCLLKQYEIQVVRVKGSMQPNSTLPVERCLWHGTDEVSLQKICKLGFNRSYCGVNGVYHGQGVYFARDSSYSANDQYSKPNAAGIKHMIYTRVITGEFVLGNPQMKTPPPRQYGNNANYDSTVNNVNDPSVFVVYHDAQAYPEFVIKFQ